MDEMECPEQTEGGPRHFPEAASAKPGDADGQQDRQVFFQRRVPGFGKTRNAHVHDGLLGTADGAGESSLPAAADFRCQRQRSRMMAVMQHHCRANGGASPEWKLHAAQCKSVDAACAPAIHGLPCCCREAVAFALVRKESAAPLSGPSALITIGTPTGASVVHRSRYSRLRFGQTAAKAVRSGRRLEPFISNPVPLTISCRSSVGSRVCWIMSIGFHS